VQNTLLQCGYPTTSRQPETYTVNGTGTTCTFDMKGGGIYQAGLTFYVDVGYLNAHVITHILVKYVFYKAVSSKICRYLQNKNTQKTTQQKICSDANRNFMQVKHHRLGTNVREHYYKMEYFQRRILTVFSPTFCI